MVCVGVCGRTEGLFLCQYGDKELDEGHIGWRLNGINLSWLAVCGNQETESH